MCCPFREQIEIATSMIQYVPSSEAALLKYLMQESEKC
jgi:hypothetical protein